MKTKLLGMCVLAAGALALAACGSSSSSSSSSSSGDVTAFCDQVHALTSLGATFQSLTPGDLPGAKAAFQTADDALKKADAVAPSEVKADMDAVVTVFDDLNSKIQAANSAADINQIGQTLKPDLQSLQQHSATLKAYAQANCK